MGLHDPFEYLKHKLSPKGGSRIKLPIWILTTKSKKLFYFTCIQVACHIPLESFWWGLQLFFRPHFNRRSAQNVMGLQSCKNPNFGNFGIPNLGIPRQNDIWVLAPCLATNNTMRGKVMASPNFEPWWVLWVCVCPWLVCAPKVLHLCINQLVVWFVHIHVNNWPTCHSS